ncbi:hypothetical protein POX_d04898 [Penicillium oxalicum]|uniref:Uncharacterized protein n=1 Tax=Penicillium oxalicum (strain 114-2 / CGMCC 5302) TaxID=933388 RepID=S8BDA4_PENO1|nr:hypothetical protein POX_d04898 [Penicillium oxalicum]EPS32952.1 hypothetical protein PDE_07913 [Penicillium oxalicum 114-2]KAI2789410.1 hypothetical protein POX_d04898 [Penicillium oxalicum]
MEAISRDLGEQKNKTPILRDNGGGPAMQTPAIHMDDALDEGVSSLSSSKLSATGPPFDPEREDSKITAAEEAGPAKGTLPAAVPHRIKHKLSIAHRLSCTWTCTCSRDLSSPQIVWSRCDVMIHESTNPPTPLQLSYNTLCSAQPDLCYKRPTLSANYARVCVCAYLGRSFLHIVASSPTSRAVAA